MEDLTYQELIRLGASRPDLRPHIRPILATLKTANSRALDKTAGHYDKLQTLDIAKLLRSQLDKADLLTDDIYELAYTLNERSFRQPYSREAETILSHAAAAMQAIAKANSVIDRIRGKVS